MVDIIDVTKSTVCDCTVMCSALREYGGGSMGDGLLNYGTDMLAIGEKIGIEQGLKEGLAVGFSEGFSQGNIKGLIKGSLITASAIAVVGVTVWGVKKLAEKRREKSNEQEEKPRQKLYTVKNFGITDEGINFYPDDQFKIILLDKKSAVIVFDGEEEHSYEVPLSFLCQISDFEEKNP